MAKQFQIGTTYSTRSICDYDCIFRFTAIKRTAKTVTFQYHDRQLTRRVRLTDDGVEMVNPLGSYSMAPVISADRLAD